MLTGHCLRLALATVSCLPKLTTQSAATLLWFTPLALSPMRTTWKLQVQPSGQGRAPVMILNPVTPLHRQIHVCVFCIYKCTCTYFLSHIGIQLCVHVQMFLFSCIPLSYLHLNVPVSMHNSRMLPACRKATRQTLKRAHETAARGRALGLCKSGRQNQRTPT